MQYDAPVTHHDLMANLEPLEDAIAPTRDAGIQVELGGDLPDTAAAPMKGQGELIGIAVALLILVLAFGSVVGSGLPVAVALVGLDHRDEPVEPGGHPPVPAPEHRHRGRHEDHPDEGRVEGDRDGHPDPELFDHDVDLAGEAEEDGNHDRGGDGDDPAGRGEAATTLPVASPVSSQSSRTRESRKTS